MPRRDIVVVGASAGGVEALIELARGLPPELPAAVLVVLHLPAAARSALPEILSRAGPLPAAHPVDGEAIRPGRIYVAPPNRHLLVEPGRLRLGDGPRENRVRPSADVLFRSAARAYGPRVVGVVLSGTDGDGTLGLEAIKLRGGTAVAQDPAEAAFPSMPSTAIERAGVDHVAAMVHIPHLLARLVGGQPGAGGEEATMSPDDEAEMQRSLDANVPVTDQKRDGTASGLTCPDCHGSIWELAEGHLVGFECRVGHRYNPEAFLGAQAARVEDALWTAVNVLQERAATLRQFAARFSSGGGQLAAEYEAWAKDTDEQAAVIRRLITDLIHRDTAGAAEAS